MNSFFITEFMRRNSWWANSVMYSNSYPIHSMFPFFLERKKERKKNSKNRVKSSGRELAVQVCNVLFQFHLVGLQK